MSSSNTISINPSDSDNTASLQLDPISPQKRWIKWLGWGALTLCCLIFFTVLKIPDHRIKNLINDNITSVLASRGITFTATESKLSYFLGITYTLKDITLTPPPPTSAIHIKQIQVSPSLLSLMFGSYGGKVNIQNGDGNFYSSFSLKNTKLSFSFKSKKMDLGKLGVMPLFLGFEGSLFLNGKGSISGDLNIPSSLEGYISLQVSQLIIDQQTIAGFSIPKSQISEGNADIEFEKGKLNIKNFRLGKQGTSTDDLQGTVSGDLLLAKQWESSSLNLKTQFTISESIKKSFILLESFLEPGKQSNGSYAYNITGPVYAPVPVPANSAK